MALGFGVGLRTRHYSQFLNGSPKVDWLEAISENFMGTGGRPLAVLHKVRQDRPVVLHGVSLAIGSVDPFDAAYLKQLKELADQIEPAMISDHLCWGRAHGKYVHDLLPLPLTEEAVRHVVTRVQQLQDYLGRQFVLENVSSYMEFKESQYKEWEFLNEISRRSGCGILLDVNNIFVSAHNHGFAPRDYLHGVRRESVKQFHLAGHDNRGPIILDTHEGHVSTPVWELYREAVLHFGNVPALIEWDEAVPELDMLLAEAEIARSVAAKALAEPVPPVPAPEAPGAPSTRRDFSGVVSASAPSLAALQDRVFGWLTAPDAIDDADALVHGGALSPTDRVNIYAEMYWLRIRDVLRDDYTRLRARMGDDAFDAMCSKYLVANISTHPSLSFIGARLPEFLSTQEVPLFYRDLAALERARTAAFIAPDGPTLETAALARLGSAFGWAVMSMQPSLHLLALSHDVISVFNKPEVLPEARLQRVVVWRQGFTVFHVEVPADEALALQRAMEGQTLTEVCEAFAAREDPANAAFAAISSWTGEGMVSTVHALPNTIASSAIRT